MWIFTKIGFFSIVQDFDKPFLLHVRARAREDIDRMKAYAQKHSHGPRLKILETPERDYRFRFAISRCRWSVVSKDLAADIDYPNFKNATHGESDRDNAYMRVWSAMADFQHERRQPRAKTKTARGIRMGRVPDMPVQQDFFEIVGNDEEPMDPFEHEAFPDFDPADSDYHNGEFDK